ncbi:MAG: hypothetical protein KDA57_21660 [Planctomycetales bacterium]|nr:hypothetical protein [Planctomycetales bacterium]
MCWFVTIAVPTASGQLVAQLASMYPPLSVTPVHSGPTKQLFPEGRVCFEITHGGCSCDLFPESQPDAAELLEKERAHLAKKGWSAAKIARAIEAKAQSMARPKHTRPESGMFRSLVCDLVQRDFDVRAFAHFYGGNQRTESIPPVPEAHVSVQAFRQSGFPPDTVVRVGTES